MLQADRLSFDQTVDVLKAAAEPTRLRLILLLARNDLTVTDLTSILGQSQPRISRHLKLLVESGMIDRFQEGAWAYFRLSARPSVERVVSAVVGELDGNDPVIARDRHRLDEIRRKRAERAAEYFSRNASSWDRIRTLHAPDAEVERALLTALGEERIEAMLDIGTGTGRLLEVLAPRYERAVGVDASRQMLSFARAKLDHAGIRHASVRLGDAYHLPTEQGAFDLVTIHQVLHYLNDPAGAVREAASALTPGGRLVVIDFAPHGLEFLRDEHAHMRLGFSHDTVAGYLKDAGLDLETVRDLDPGRGEPDQLTVSLWVARDLRHPVSVVKSVSRSVA